ncbi:nucleoside monophosphate kinase [Candidatus Parcubacteria bacterium]|nr:nucleoside monophosphate kinase [Candidatus Parcubacteria bacterium]
MLHTVIFIGRSGCGKGTQASLLKERLIARDPDKRQLLYVETGERFRQFIRGGSYSSRLSKEIYDADKRQANFLGSFMWSQTLIEELEENMHIFFDGVARSRPEAELLTTAFEFYKRERPVVVYLNVSRKWSEDRLLARGREDDTTLAKITKRLDWFEKDTLPAVEYLKQSSFYKFLDINGEQSIEKVERDIVAAYESD